MTRSCITTVDGNGNGKHRQPNMLLCSGLCKAKMRGQGRVIISGLGWVGVHAQ